MPPDGIASYRPSVSGVTHMVSAGHYLAAAAGYRILEQGGNAVDAGVASGIAINVTLPHMTSFGGVAPIIIYLAETNEVVTVSGLGRWPKAVSLELMLDTYGEIPRGIPRSVVPSACDAWLTALEHYGTMSFEQVVTPALELVEDGFPASHRLAASIAGSAPELLGSPEAMEAFMPAGRPPAVGDTLRRPGLAKVFRWMIDAERGAASEGRRQGIRAARDVFYKGEVAERMVRFCRERGGYLAMDDFEDFHVRVEPPETAPYKDYDVYTCGAWCQGPSLLQVLNILEGVDLSSLGHNSADYVHTAVEAVKLVFADRDAYYGDPDFVDVPMETLLSKEYAARRREMIDAGRAWPEMPPPGNAGAHAAPVSLSTADGGPWEGDTSYTCVVDAAGNAFSATPSDGEVGVPLVPGIGMGISTRGSQSWLDPEHPSSLAPWKRPRLTPNPALALRDGKLFMPFGTPGGDAQVQAMAQLFLNVVEFGMDPQQANRGAAFRQHELSQLVLATRLPARSAGTRVPHRRRRDVPAGRPGPRDRAVARLGGADRRGLRDPGGPWRAVRGRRSPPRVLRHRTMTAAQPQPGANAR